MTLKRKLGFESLESRRVCAGNVTAKVLNGTLTITGDDNHNSIEVQQAVVVGVLKFVVTGKNFNGSFTGGDPVATGPSTAINGGVAPFRAAATKLVINMGHGNDAVVLGKGTTDATQIDLALMQIKMGTQSDYLKVTNVRVETTAKTVLDMTNVGGTTQVGQGEIGNDKLVVDRLDLVTTTLDASTGGGADTTIATNIHSNALINFFAGVGKDTLNVSNCSFRNVKVSMGPDTNTTGDAGDLMTVKSINATAVDINMGAGDDDHLNLVSAVKVTSSTIINGGLGLRDRLSVGSSTVQCAGRQITGFEIKPQGL